MEDVRIRNVKDEDIAFIYATWLRSYRESGILPKRVRKHIFFTAYGMILDNLLTAKNTQIIIACRPEDEDTILGYIVFEKQILHYIYVKELFQGYKIGNELYKAAFPKPPTDIYITAMTDTDNAQGFIKSKPQFIYDPFILFNKGETNGKSTG